MPVPEIPNRFLCHITLDIMFDPVLAADGRIYERSTIERWLREHNNTSPFTREIISNRLTQNTDLRSEILEFLDLNAHYIHEAIATLSPDNNHIFFIKALIKRSKNNLNRIDEAGQTPLHIAVINRKIEVIDPESNINIIQLLLREGANYKIRNNQHRTAKKEAKELGFWDVVDLIDNYVMRDTSQMDLNELRLTITEIQQQELQTQDAVVRLTNQMQRLTVHQPSFLRFFSWQTMELLAIGTMVAGTAIVVQHQRNTTRKLDEQSKVIEDLQLRLSNLALLKQEQQMHKEAISFLYDKMKDSHKVAFDTKAENGLRGSASDIKLRQIAVPEGFQRDDCKFLFITEVINHYGSGSAEWCTLGTDSLIDIPSIMRYTSGSAYGASYGAFVLAAKPVMSDQEIKQKKKEYKLLA